MIRRKMESLLDSFPYRASLETDGKIITFICEGGYSVYKDGNGEVFTKNHKNTRNPIEKEFKEFAEKMLKKYGRKEKMKTA